MVRRNRQINENLRVPDDAPRGIRYMGVPQEGHSRSIRPHYLSRYASKYNFGIRLMPILQPSILGLWAWSYTYGSHTRLSSDHFQSARSAFGYAVRCTSEYMRPSAEPVRRCDFIQLS